ncbi:MAG: hypothetical protein ACTHZI_11875 [Luteimonas sp.]
MNTFANAGYAAPSAPAEAKALEIDGSRVQVIAAALPAFAEQAPQAQLANYIVHVNAPDDGVVQVVFEPRQPEGQPPTLGGRNPNGPEVNVWVRKADYSVDRVSLAR